MKTVPRKAVVVGALGVIGRYIVDKLLADGDWQVVGLSSRAMFERLLRGFRREKIGP